MTLATVPLRHVAEVRVSNVDKKSGDGELPVRLCNYTDVYYNRVITPDMEFMTATASPSQVARFRLQRGDTIITKDSETADDIAVPTYVSESAHDLVCGYHLAVLRPDPEAVSPRYLSWAVGSDFCQEQFSVSATGVTRFGLKYESILGVAVPLPPLPVQRRIADFLDDHVSRIDAAHRGTEQQISLLRSREMGWLDHQMQMLDSEFGRMPLRRWITHIEQGWSPLCDSRPADAQEAGVLKLGAVRGGRFREHENKAMSADTAPVPQYEIRPRDLLVSRANTPELVGEAAVVPDGVRSQLYLCDLLYRVRTSIDEVEFISAALRSRRTRGLLGVIARGTSQSMVKLRGEDIANVSIPAAPSAARRMLADEAATTMADSDAAVAAIQGMRTLLQERKRALITAAVTGEFDVATTSGRDIA